MADDSDKEWDTKLEAMRQDWAARLENYRVEDARARDKARREWEGSIEDYRLKTQAIAETNRQKWEAKTLLFDKQFGLAQHGDRLAGDIGIAFLRALLLVNSGAVIALLAFFTSGGTMASAHAGPIASALPGFVGSLVLALFSTGIAYIYQRVECRKYWHRVDNTARPEGPAAAPADAKSGKKMEPLSVVTWVLFGVVVVSAFSSFVIFSLTAFRLICGIGTALGAA